MHRHAAGLVQHQQRIVLVNNFKMARGHGLQAAFCRFFRCAHGWNPNQITGLNACFRFGAPLVHPHFARTDNAVDMALGHALQNFYQIVVKALRRFMFLHANMID